MDRHTILRSMPLYKGFNRLTELTYRFRRLDGKWSEAITREIFERGLAGAVLPYDPVLDRVVLVRQFRPGALLANASGWEMEPIAGICEDGESPQATVEREAMVEAGCRFDALEDICVYNVSPGCVNEAVAVFFGCVDSQSVDASGGDTAEHEETEVCVVDFDAFKADLDGGKFTYALTIIAAQWLVLNREMLREKWAPGRNDD